MRLALVGRICIASCLVLFVIATNPARGQQTTAQDGRVASSTVGQAGQRQTREQAAPNIQPMDRIASRIQNRVQSRLRTRIDRDEAPIEAALTTFAAADEQTRTPGRPRR